MWIDPRTPGLETLHKAQHFALQRVAPQSLPKLWDVVEPALDKYPELWNQVQTKEALLYALANEFLDLWILSDENHDAKLTFITRDAVYPAAKVFEVVWAVGTDIFDYLDVLLSMLQDVAASRNCNFFVIKGQRLGWMKPLQERGFVVEHVSMVRPVSGAGNARH